MTTIEIADQKSSQLMSCNASCSTPTAHPAGSIGAAAEVASRRPTTRSSGSLLLPVARSGSSPRRRQRARRRSSESTATTSTFDDEVSRSCSTPSASAWCSPCCCRWHSPCASRSFRCSSAPARSPSPASPRRLLDVARRPRPQRRGARRTTAARSAASSRHGRPVHRQPRPHGPRRCSPSAGSIVHDRAHHPGARA